MAKFEPVDNNTGMDPVGRDYSQVSQVYGLSFDPCMQAPVKSYEEMQERERADRERSELEEREGRRLTETAINIALMGACLGGS